MEKVFYFGHECTHFYYICPRCRDVVILLDYTTDVDFEFTARENAELKLYDHIDKCIEETRLKRKKAKQSREHRMLFAK